jgi:hypothetical protein
LLYFNNMAGAIEFAASSGQIEAGNLSDAMPPPLERYAAVDLIEGPKLTRVSSAPEACAGNSNLLKTPAVSTGRCNTI